MNGCPDSHYLSFCHVWVSTKFSWGANLRKNLLHMAVTSKILITLFSVLMCFIINIYIFGWSEAAFRWIHKVLLLLRLPFQVPYFDGNSAYLSNFFLGYSSQSAFCVTVVFSQFLSPWESYRNKNLCLIPAKGWPTFCLVSSGLKSSTCCPRL